jgi:2-dehydro-3-deoxyphosphooctonate aldolase (KDO 8-P synthase)
LFFEVHDDPDHALCDGPSQIPLGAFAEILDGVLAIDAAARKHQTPLL